MMDKLNKAAGELQLRDQRRLDAVPARPTPKKVPRARPIRPFGYSFDRRQWNFGSRKTSWVRKTLWFDSETSRDQALAAAYKRANDLERDFKKEQR